MTGSARSPRWAGLGAAAVVASALLFAPSAAVADPASDGFWYFDDFSIQAAHDAGFTGEGVTIVVVDTQLNPEVPTLRDADIEVLESICYTADGELIPPTSTDVKAAEHGTNVVSYLVGSGEGYPGQTGVKGIAPDAKIIFASTGAIDDSGEVQCNEGGEEFFPSALKQGFEAAIEADADVISISVSGSSGPALEPLTRVLAIGIPVVVAVANEEDAAFGTGFPKSGNGVIGVQSVDVNVNIQGDHTDVLTDVVGPGVNLVWQGDASWEQQRYATGTSLATPIVAGFMALVAQKYPEATGNQLIQSLIRNTGGEDHELFFDAENKYGFGVASATHMLRVDPTKYDDVNPLIGDAPTEIPSIEEIEAAAEALAGEADPSPSPDGPTTPTVPWLPILIGAGVLVLIVIAAVVIIIVVAAKRRTPRP